MKTKKCALLAMSLLLSNVEPAFANLGPGPTLSTIFFLFPIVLILFSFIGGIYGIHLFKQKKRILSRVLYIIIFLWALGSTFNAPFVIAGIFLTSYGIIRGCNMCALANKMRGIQDSKLPKDFSNANPKRLMISGILLIILTAALSVTMYLYRNEPSSLYRRGVDNAAQADLKNAYSSAQAFFYDYPKGKITVEKLLEYGFNPTKNVSLSIVRGEKEALNITAHHDEGFRTYSVNSKGEITH